MSPARPRARRPDASRAERLVHGLPFPVMVVDAEDRIVEANAAAEAFFETSLAVMARTPLPRILPFASPLIALLQDARARDASVSEHRMELRVGEAGGPRALDVFAAPVPDDPDALLVTLIERTMADKMDRQLSHRGAARSVTALGLMLAHEIKNPLSGIRGAAQLLEMSATDEDRALTRLICDETDRIVRLVERMEVFADERPLPREPVNIHLVLDHVKSIAASGFARHIRFIESYDPSLPPVLANRDALVQIMLNLVKNAAEAIGPDAVEGEIELGTAFRPGVRVSSGRGGAKVGLPLEVRVRDNGPGVPAEIVPNLFDPFVTTKASGTGLGLALVAKVVGEHGGVVECDPAPRRTTFRVLLPIHKGGSAASRREDTA